MLLYSNQHFLSIRQPVPGAGGRADKFYYTRTFVGALAYERASGAPARLSAISVEKHQLSGRVELSLSPPPSPSQPPLPPIDSGPEH